jgi:hypothetical protein
MLQHIIEWLTGPAGQSVELAIVYVVLMTVVGRKSQIDAWCMKNPRWAGLIKIVRGICPGDPFLLIQGLALIVFRRMPTAYQTLVTTIVPPTHLTNKTALAPPTADGLNVLEHD